MEFFDKIGEKASHAYKATTDKTGKFAKEAKLKFKMSDLKSQIDDIYMEIGAKIYEKHLLKESINIETELEEQCTKIDILSNQIETILKDCLELKDKKQCVKCSAQFDKSFKFCPECGARQGNLEYKQEDSIINNEFASINVKDSKNENHFMQDKVEEFEKTESNKDDD